jgi:O-antigen ligase
MKSSEASNTEAGIGSTGSNVRETVVLLERAIVVCLFVFAIAAPHSIAATQISWTVGLLLWAIRYGIKPRPRLFRSPIDYPLIGFFILTGLAAFTSYEPMVSIGKLRAASLFTIVYLFAQNIPSRRVVRLLALTIVASCMINVLFTFGERIVGRGLKVTGVNETSPLYLAGIRSGDTLLEIDGRKLSKTSELILGLGSSSVVDNPVPAKVKIYRFELIEIENVDRGRLLDGTTDSERLGVASITRGRDWRAAGFYGHYTTYSEVLQLVGSLAFGLFISVRKKLSSIGVLLAIVVAGMSAALVMTVTRASMLSFLISATVIVLFGASRKTVLYLFVLAIPIVLAGLFLLQQKRNVGFFDQKDASTTWRKTVYRDGINLLVSKPRHLLVGVGMDSIKKHACEWKLFDNCRLPIGHMHSNLLEFAVERGVPALLVWLVFIGFYARMLWRMLRSGQLSDWMDRGITIGAIGGLVGFFSSGLVHYNWGDSEVVMVLYFIIGLCAFINHESTRTNLANSHPIQS